MPWVRFTADFDFKPKPQVTVAYKAGMVMNVTTPCADRAVARGKAVKMRKAAKHAPVTEDAGKSEV